MTSFDFNGPWKLVAGTIIKLNGVPFRLINDSLVYGDLEAALKNPVGQIGVIDRDGKGHLFNSKTDFMRWLEKHPEEDNNTFRGFNNEDGEEWK